MKIRKQKLNLFIVGYIMFLIVLSALGYFAADYQIKLAEHKAIQKVLQNPSFKTDLAFYDMPRMTLSITSGNNGKEGRIRLDISLEIAKKDMTRLEDYQSRINDRVIAYVRTIDTDDLEKPASVMRFHENLLDQVNIASRPIPVHDILFRQFLLM